MDNFTIEDLLDFTNEEEEAVVSSDGFLNSTESSSLTAVEHYEPSLFSPHLTADSFISGVADILAPCDDTEELEWLSNFVEESFSSKETAIELHLVSNPKEQVSTHLLIPQGAVPARARRSKRSRAMSCEWSSSGRMAMVEESEGGRRCRHCSTEKTPQWRTGPLGAKTLCNACGVRFKSGRLVPEYRPAASPTFISTEHSNSHRKVVELRRQKEFQNAQHDHQPQHLFFSLSNCDGYFLHHP